MATPQRIVQVPRNYYQLVHETRYRDILGAGALFRQERMNPWVAEAWEAFRAATDIRCGALGIEFGSGTGINSIIISLQGFQMIGLDISATATRRAAELAEARGSRAQFLVGDMFRSPLAAETFGFAVNIWSLHVVGEQPCETSTFASVGAS